ncbi:Galactokinase [Metschnikowia bicuspidata var. bicuspidata NRRL YB-4993]|uniref:Galactokinase n=1 Tax=Metschnikowia bicuspidata var. bicuspidata NRRL YB-4993 TaxID=869754 RepID=A0A1A0HGW7_9ASCO|nr:Galactokinase [Metschnikowia bicuspidata var. bicuspidata NRRL YB-4993]OBA23093.1 Galactokinase [Metschnikowia bicuspidata var. bicuspidata NRRL YB-4993]
MVNVPSVLDVSFYSDQKGQESRYASVRQKFSKTFGVSPLFFARAPGRVNLIGEHIDYCHFSVLPMAIEVDVIAAVAPSGTQTITIANTNTKFVTTEIRLPQPADADIPINKDLPLWADYFKCGLVVARNYMRDTGKGNIQTSGAMAGFYALFDGTVPAGGGLSSSAAFCIAATLAVLQVNGVTGISKADLTKITVVCEHYVGLSNGGMDQSASINGEPGKVMLISFKPHLAAVPFALPSTNPETVFLISNSLVTANKTETAPSNYNLRVVEVAVAADIIVHRFGLVVDKDSNIGTATLRGAFDAYFTQTLGKEPWDGTDIDVGISRLQQMLQVVDQMYSDAEKRAGLSVDAAVAKAGAASRADFEHTYLSHFPVRFAKLQIYRRTRHVFSDSMRVLETLREARQFAGDSRGFLQKVGALMDESQVLTRDMNMASTEECDALCEVGRAHGAYGSRVTGAGFGGCVVHVTTADRLQRLRQALVDEYYKRRFPALSEADLAEAIVVSRPAMGACIVYM